MLYSSQQLTPRDSNVSVAASTHEILSTRDGVPVALILTVINEKPLSVPRRVVGCMMVSDMVEPRSFGRAIGPWGGTWQWFCLVCIHVYDVFRVRLHGIRHYSDQPPHRELASWMDLALFALITLHSILSDTVLTGSPRGAPSFPPVWSSIVYVNLVVSSLAIPTPAPSP